MFRRLQRKAARTRRIIPVRNTAFFLAFLILVAGGFDLASTNVALAAGQIEGNPVVRMVMSEAGQWWSVPKMAFHLVLAFSILLLPSRRMICTARIVVAGYIAIAMNNFYLAGTLSPLFGGSA